MHAGSLGQVTDAMLLDWVGEVGATFPVMSDRSGTYGEYDRVGANAPFPLDVIVDQGGTVRYTSAGYEPEQMEAIVRELLAD